MRGARDRPPARETGCLPVVMDRASRSHGRGKENVKYAIKRSGVLLSIINDAGGGSYGRDGPSLVSVGRRETYP